MPARPLIHAVEAALAAAEAIAARPELTPEEAQAIAAPAAAARARLARQEVVIAVVGEARAGKTSFVEALTALGVPAGFRLLDTPGLNAEGAEATWALVAGEADAVWLVSDLQQAVSRTTRDAVAAIGRLAPHVLLVLTKADRALANAELAADPAAEVAEARRVAVKRFAGEVARDPADVLAAMVAARPALLALAASAPTDTHASPSATPPTDAHASPSAAADGPDAANALRAELAPLWDVLATERALALAARAAALLTDATDTIRAAMARAQQAAQARISQLEAQRLPDPAAYVRTTLDGVHAALRDEDGWKQAARAFRNAFARQGVRWEMAIRKGISEEEVRAAAQAAAGEARAAIAQLLADTRGVALEALAERGAAAREQALAGLRARYQLVGQIAGVQAAFPEPPPLDVEASGASLATGFEAVLASFDDERTKLHLGGAAAGAAVGTAIAPGLGTAIGALVGSLGGLFYNLDVLKDDLVKALASGLATAERQALGEIVEGGAAAEAATGSAIARDMGEAIAAVSGHIEALLAAEHARLDAAHGELATLRALGEQLEAALAALVVARQQAAQASRGLARV